MIDKATIDRITDAADIVEVVGEFVSLRKRGVNYLGNCPFHNEKTPSFTVSKAKGIFKCFGCGKSGNTVSFIMSHEGLSYPEALKYIAKKYSIEVKEKELTPKEKEINDDRESMLIVNEYAVKYFSNVLNNSDEGKAIAKSYFKEREISEAMITKFQLGYSLQDKKAFTTEALRKSFKIKFLEQTGLTIARDNWQIDRFHSRVMFPIHSLSGKVVGFGGRILTNDKKTAKYLNSPDSDIYNKSKVLYGLYQAKREISNQDCCLLVEGYTDVISLHHCGIENVVSSSGTSLTEDQIRLIRRFTSNIVVLYDGDAAGIKASLRGINMILASGLNVKVVSLPEGEDPDSYSKKLSASDFKKFIEDNKTDFIKFKTNLLINETKNDPIKRSEVIIDIVESIAVIPNSIVQSVYIKECSEDLNISEKIILNEVAKSVKKKRFKPSNNFNQQSVNQTSNLGIGNTQQVNTRIPKSRLSPVEKSIMYLFIKFGHKILYINNEEDVEEVSVAEFIINEIELDEISVENKLLIDIMDLCRNQISKKEPITEKLFLNAESEDIKQLSINIYTSKYVLSTFWTKGGNFIEREEENLKFISEKTILAFKHYEICKMIKVLDNEIKNAGNDYDIIFPLLEKRNKVKPIERKFAKDLGRE